jgi:hypothetical protein
MIAATSRYHSLDCAQALTGILRTSKANGGYPNRIHRKATERRLLSLKSFGITSNFSGRHCRLRICSRQLISQGLQLGKNPVSEGKHY